MKCLKCNFENSADSNFCINCGAKLKNNNYYESFSSNNHDQTFNEHETIDYYYSKYYYPNLPFSENFDKIFSENDFTIDQINKITSCVEKNNDESIIKKLIEDEISNNKNPNELSDDEYKLIFDFSKKVIMDDLNGEGITFIQYKGTKTITTTQMRKITEEVPVVKQKHGGLTKGVATLGFGLIGLAGTSGVKTEMKTVEKKVPTPVQKIVEDINNVKLMVKNNQLEIKHNNLKTIIKFSEIEEINQEHKFIYLKTNKDMITLKIWDKYFSDLLTKALSENIYYLKNYKTIKNRYIDTFSSDLNDIWISELLAFNINTDEPSEIDKIELIKKYHSLKESGIITEEEFEKKKQELLN